MGDEQGRPREVAMVTSSSENVILVLDPRTGTQLASFKNNLSATGSASLMGSAFIVASQTKGSALHIWSWGTEQPRLKCHGPEKIGPICCPLNGAYCCGGSSTGRLYMWEVGSGALIRSWDAHYKAVTKLCVSNDGKYMYSSGEDCMLSAWNLLEILDTGSAMNQGGSGLSAEWTSSDHLLPLTSIAVSHIGGRVFTASLDRTSKIFEANTGQLLHSVICPCLLHSVVADPQEDYVFMGGVTGVIYQLDTSVAAATATKAEAMIVAGKQQRLGLTNGGRSSSLFLGSEGGSVSGGQLLQELRGHTKSVVSLACTIAGGLLVSASEDGTLRTWHTASRQCIHTIELSSKGSLSQVILLLAPASILSNQGEQTKVTHPLAPFKKHLAAVDVGLQQPTPVVIVPGHRHEPPCRSAKRTRIEMERLGSSIISGNSATVTSVEDNDTDVNLQDNSQEHAAPGDAVEGGAEEDHVEEVVDPVVLSQENARLIEENRKLTDEAARWRKVNQALMQKVGGKGAKPKKSK